MSIDCFLSLVDLSRFIRLRSLTLFNIDCEDLGSFLNYAGKRCSPTSLALRSALSTCLREEEIAQRLSSILAQPSLLHLETLVLGEATDSFPCYRYRPEEWFSRVLHTVPSSPEDHQLLTENNRQSSRERSDQK